MAENVKAEWWRSAVIYQVYPRSFADSDGDGIGDLPGITARLSALRELGVDALWLSPFYPSPQRDAGYDVSDYCAIDPLFGTLDDFDALRKAAQDNGLRFIIDLVPNHTSSDHEWFQEALATDEGSAERERYMFRDGKGKGGSTPPNNWQSVFGGPAWTRVIREDGTSGQWYLHLFDASQPDLNWENPWVRDQFHRILRFWLDRGVDGFRVDVAHGLVKAPGLPDYMAPPGGSMTVDVAGLNEKAEDKPSGAPYWGQPGVHEIYRNWRSILDEYDGDRVLVAEAWVNPLSKLALWVRADEMDQAFNFAYLQTPWSASELRNVIDGSLSAFGAVGAPSTWVLSNHDVIRHRTRLCLSGENLQSDGIGPDTGVRPDPVASLRRARAATGLMAALPGSAYLYQGEELGLPEVINLPDDARHDPTFFRTHGQRYGRDGCRVPIPWSAEPPTYGFNDSGKSWLPAPHSWADMARDVERGVDTSTLELYRAALALRRENGLGLGTLDWLDGYGDDAVAFRNGNVTVITNAGTEPVALPVGHIVLSTDPLQGNELPPDTTAWLV